MTAPQPAFPLGRMPEIQQRPQDFRLLERIPITREDVNEILPIRLAEPEQGERTHQIVFLDTETTGFDPLTDKIIELGMVRATFAYDRRVLLSIDRVFQEFEDPKGPIPERITEITHITDDMVRGKEFNMDAVTQVLAGRPLVIAHNAKFDRPFFDRRFAILDNLSWGCSQEIDWMKAGSQSGKLEYLTMYRGWFYEAHRACVDCLALAWLMHIEPDALGLVCDRAITPEYKLTLRGNTFDIKDRIKAMGFKFDGTQKVWHKTFRDERSMRLELESIGQFYDAGQAEIEQISAKNRYKR